MRGGWPGRLAFAHRGRARRAYLTETRETVDEYLTRFEKNPHGLLSEQLTEFPASVSTTWSVSTSRLSPDAEHLFNLCAFFSPEPIAVELFLNHAEAVSEPSGLREFLSSSPRFRAAATQMHRFSLVKVDGARDLIQMHRVVQAVTRDQLRQNRPDAFLAYARPWTPCWPSPTRATQTGSATMWSMTSRYSTWSPNVPSPTRPIQRCAVSSSIRCGGCTCAAGTSKRCGSARKRCGSGANDSVLTIWTCWPWRSRWRSPCSWTAMPQMPAGSSWTPAPCLKHTYGSQHEVTLPVRQRLRRRLRTHGQFSEALELDRGLLPKFEETFGPDHERTLNVWNNIAADYRRLGRFGEAMEIDLRTFDDRRHILGDNDPRTLYSQDMVASDLRGLGRYQESLDTARKVVAAFAAAGGRENPDWLNARTGFAAALRKAGHHWDALQWKRGGSAALP